MLARRLRSDIYALTIDDDLRGDVLPFADAGARAGDLTIFHFALPSPMTAAFASLPGATGAAVPQHHARPLLRAVRSELFRLAALGRQELRSLVGHVDLALGDSEFNRQELEADGVRPDGGDADRGGHGPHHRSAAAAGARDDSLGRLDQHAFRRPNRAEQADRGSHRLAEVYKRYVDSYYRFIFVGRYDVVPRYYAQVRALIAEFQMLPDRFWFTGAVPDDDLAAFYRWADVYVSLSEHEGFCVPLVEAMAADVPVLAYAAGAVPETLGGAGVLFAPKDLEFAAEMLGMLVYDRPVRERVLDGTAAAPP